jgi:hypothetical protein
MVKLSWRITLIATAIALQFDPVYRNAFKSTFAGVGAQKLLSPAFVLARPPLAILKRLGMVHPGVGRKDQAPRVLAKRLG